VGGSGASAQGRTLSIVWSVCWQKVLHLHRYYFRVVSKKV
jgi:hypothetical protein